MRTITIFLVVTLTSLAHAEPTQVILVRHAERAAEPMQDPALSIEGVRRTEALAEALAKANVTSIITTQFRRTRETAAPLAKAQKIEPVVLATKKGDSDAHIRDVTKTIQQQSGVVLVVGHSNTVTPILAALGGPALPLLCETNFDVVFVWTPATVKTPSTMMRWRYGAPNMAASAVTDCLQ